MLPALAHGQSFRGAIYLEASIKQIFALNFGAGHGAGYASGTNSASAPGGGAVSEGRLWAAGAGRSSLQMFFIYLVSVLLTALPVMLHFVNPFLAIGAQVLLVSGVALFLTPMAPFVVVVSMVFQNYFVSLFSGYLTGQEDYAFVRGYNFLTTVILWLWLFGQYALNWRSFSDRVNRIMLACLVGYGLIGFYLLLGMAKNPVGAIMYLRNVITPLVTFQIFFLVSLRSRLPNLTFFTVLTVIILVMGYIEMIDRSLWFDLSNGWTLWEVTTRDALLNLLPDLQGQKSGIYLTSIFDNLKVQFLNTPLLGDRDLTILRMSGPNGHPISYSYVLGFLAILMITNRRWYFAILIIPLLLMASAKGVLIMMFLVFCALVANRLFGAVFAYGSLVLVLFAYILLGIVTGLKIGDFHVLGFMGGLYNFLGDPFGNGLGDGGNLLVDFTSLDWEAYQAAGRTPFAMESAVAVLLHQMGVASAGLLGVYCWLSLQSYKLFMRSGVNLHAVASFMVIIAMVNGVFQEEAIFSPLALALILGLNGLILGSSLKPSAYKS